MATGACCANANESFRAISYKKGTVCEGSNASKNSGAVDVGLNSENGSGQNEELIWLMMENEDGEMS